jgi:monoterpene epsilon-lactone hydrolase
MPSPASQRIRAALLNNRESPVLPLAVSRQAWEAAAMAHALPASITVEPAAESAIRGVWVRSPESASQQILLYLHGGGYSAGSSLTHRDLGARLCLASGARVLLVDYRPAPEDPFPAAVQDAVASYQWLLEGGLSAEQIVIGGDSAGAGLAMATLVWLREHALPLPAAGVLVSPWVDLALTAPSLQTRAAVDPLTSFAGLRRAAGWYLGATDPRDPLASPLYAALHELPPLLIQVGADELLLNDATRLAQRAETAGVTVTLEVWEGMWHVWHGWAAELPEGQQAIERIGEFIRQQLRRAQP